MYSSIFKCCSIICIAILPFNVIVANSHLAADYKNLDDLSLNIGEIYCINVENVTEFLWKYYSIKNQPNFGHDFEELEALMKRTQNISLEILDQINYYARAEYKIEFKDKNYFNSMIYWHIRSIQCQSLFLIFKYIEHDILRVREDHSARLRDVFDSGQLQKSIENYIQIHYMNDLNTLSRLDYDIFDFVRNSQTNHVQKETIIERLQNLQKIFHTIHIDVYKNIISPEEIKLIENGLQFPLQSQVAIESTLTYYQWLADFMREYQDLFLKHYG